MTQNDFRNLSLTHVRKLVPEIPSWQDMIRFLRMRTGNNITSPDQLDYSNELIAAELAGFNRYAQILKYAKDNLTLNANADATNTYAEISLANTPIIIVEDFAIAKGHNATQPEIYPTKTISKPPLWKAKQWQGETLWYESGDIIGIYPARENHYTFFIYGVIRPHYDNTLTLVGVAPGDEHSIAKYIAGELIESTNPQLGLAWKNNAVSEWALKRQHLAWEEATAGRNKTYRIY